MTCDTAVALQSNTELAVAPHISGAVLDRNQVGTALSGYFDTGMRRLVVLRGDIPSGIPPTTDFCYASELVKFVKDKYEETFFIDVAAYPEVHTEAKSSKEDLVNFKRKVDAGANGAITQYFFNCDAYFRFVNDCHKVGADIPIIAGLMPITEAVGLIRFSEKCGAEIPRWVLKSLVDYADDPRSLESFGIDVLCRICSRLFEERAPGLHFFTLNKIKPVSQICLNLGLGQAIMD